MEVGEKAADKGIQQHPTLWNRTLLCAKVFDPPLKLIWQQFGEGTFFLGGGGLRPQRGGSSVKVSTKRVGPYLM